MLLNGGTIADRLRANPDTPFNNRLIITPILDWRRQLDPDAASIDVRLGQKFVIPKRTKVSHLDHLDAEHDRRIELYKDETFVPIGDFFVFHPRQFVLGETLEWIHLPVDLSAYVVGRSSWGRDGLIIATATGIHPAYSGIITLEISNVGEIPVYLYPGITIAQLFIQEVTPGVKGHGASSFRGSDKPRSENAAARDKEVILRLKAALDRSRSEFPAEA